MAERGKKDNIKVLWSVSMSAPCFSPTMNQLTFMKSFVSLEAVKNRSALLHSLDLVRHFSGSSNGVLEMVKHHVCIRIFLKLHVMRVREIFVSYGKAYLRSYQAFLRMGILGIQLPRMLGKADIALSRVFVELRVARSCLFMNFHRGFCTQEVLLVDSSPDQFGALFRRYLARGFPRQVQLRRYSLVHCFDLDQCDSLKNLSFYLSWPHHKHRFPEAGQKCSNLTSPKNF